MLLHYGVISVISLTIIYSTSIVKKNNINSYQINPVRLITLAFNYIECALVN